jgi:hypothetical protein
MNTKLLLLAYSLVISLVTISQAHAAAVLMLDKLTGPFKHTVSLSTVSLMQNLHGGGIVSKITVNSIVINAVTYRFVNNEAKVYDLNGMRNYNVQIQNGVFVSYLLSSDKARITELRLLRP